MSKLKETPKLLDVVYDIQNKYEICIDEVGRGCLFGSAYIGCVVLPKNGSFDLTNIKDSKKFSSKKKIKLVSDYIKKNSILWHIESVSSILIDEVNILQAVVKGMHSCITNVLQKMKDMGLIGIQNKSEYKNEIMAIIDGNYFKPYTWFDISTQTLVELPYITIEKGDSKYAGIAAASIIAKVARDEYIAELCITYPSLILKYGLDTNVGYGTKKHMDGIDEHGITQWHRLSFSPCKNRQITNIE